MFQKLFFEKPIFQKKEKTCKIRNTNFYIFVFKIFFPLIKKLKRKENSLFSFFFFSFLSFHWSGNKTFYYADKCLWICVVPFIDLVDRLLSSVKILSYWKLSPNRTNSNWHYVNRSVDIRNFDHQFNQMTYLQRRVVPITK